VARSKFLSIRVSEKEDQQIRDLSSRRGISVSEWLRYAYKKQSEIEETYTMYGRSIDGSGPPDRLDKLERTVCPVCRLGQPCIMHQMVEMER